MSTLKELQAQAKDLQDQLAKIHGQIKEMTDLPNGWTMDTGHGHMAGGVTIYGAWWDSHREENRDVSICAYTEGVFISDEEGNRSPTVEPEALMAAIKAMSIKRQEMRDRTRRGPR